MSAVVHWSAEMPAAEVKRRVAIMAAVHGDWIRQTYRTFGRLSCDCSKCGVRGINRTVAR